MKRMIRDEFTPLSVSRQRKWQLRRHKESRCEICGDPAPSGRCDYHRIALALAQLRHRGEPVTPRRGKWLVLAGERDSQ